MSDEDVQSGRSEFAALFQEHMRWATLSVSIQEIADDNAALVRDISRFDSKETVPLLASILTLPKYQSQCIRLEILVVLAIVFCKGKKRANVGNVVQWFRKIGESKCVSGEDPAEDVFVSAVHGDKGSYRILEGVWEGAGFYTQRILELVASMPDHGEFASIRKSFDALLIVSDIVNERSGLIRYQLGSERRREALSPGELPKRQDLVARTTLSTESLGKRHISVEDLEPFIFDLRNIDELPAQSIGNSYIDRYPLIRIADQQLVVALPTALTVAARNFVIENVFEMGLIRSFDEALARNYSKLFQNTPLLGGPMSAPAIWRKVGDTRLSSFGFEVDNGYFVSFHLFQLTVALHRSGGFKTVYEDDGDLKKSLEESIEKSIERFSKIEGFKRGLVVVSGCGWGKGCFTDYLEINHENWRLLNVSAADLVRLSWLGDMSPSYLWRVEDGYEEISKSGVHIVNPNGVLNLIGWVRSNDGHFVPHSQLPEEEISAERPLMLNPPINLLRDVRADSDNGFDRHQSIDNKGVWHDVQRASPTPFFESESERRLYTSISDVQRRELTSVYEGECQLWVSISAPNLEDKETTYRLWQMANEWLHRIGSELDTYANQNSTSKEPLKLYIEFQDSDPPVTPGRKPTAEELEGLYEIADHEEEGACIARFLNGFLLGFGIAENIAERKFVHGVVCGFMRLLNVENLAEEAGRVVGLVVTNENARSFHLFHAQNFSDYTRNSLPKELVVIDQIDDAAAKIGLGWRVADKTMGNRVVGREQCTRFLNDVVEELLSEITATLTSFRRDPALVRLVRNIEKASADAEHWKRTSAALIGLHGDDAIERFVKQMSLFAGAGIASRVLAEMAICICPIDAGNELSDIELSKLVARVALVVRLGGLSDAVHYNALTPELVISPLGDILFKDDFGRLVVEPMLSRAIGEGFVAMAPRQKRNYSEPNSITTVQGKLSDEFWDIWKGEMGFDLDEAREIIGALEDEGIRRGEAVFRMRVSNYFDSVRGDSVSQDVASAFLDQFSLSSREHWEEPPDGFSLKDLYPWKFGRRLSFVARPILRLEQDDDPMLLIAPSALRSGFAYLVDGAHSGSLDQSFFHSTLMKDYWWGKAGEGHSFTTEVATELISEGWEIRENIEIPAILNRKLGSDYGDVDVLAWRKDLSNVLVIECKDLSFARNYSEIASLLSSYQGVEVDGEPDKLKRHLNRVSILDQHLPLVSQFTGIQAPIVVSCLVCSGIVPMQYSKIDALENTRVGSVEEVLSL